MTFEKRKRQEKTANHSPKNLLGGDGMPQQKKLKLKEEVSDIQNCLSYLIHCFNGLSAGLEVTLCDNQSNQFL